MGKTRFCLVIFAKWIEEQNKTILYLTNRNSLKEQIRKEMEEQNISNARVMNYQEVEKRIVHKYAMDSPDWIIADEAHYFIQDAEMNTYSLRYANRIVNV